MSEGVLDPETVDTVAELQPLFELYGVIVACVAARQGQIRISKDEISQLIINDEKPVIDVQDGGVVITMLKREEYNAWKARNV